MSLDTATDFATQRTHWVDSQVRPNDVTDLRIIAALSEVPREAFVPAERRALAYADGRVPIGSGRTLLDARAFAKMLQLAAIGAGDRVLDVGCGTGYSTAVLALLAGSVVGLEENSGLADHAERALARVPNVTIFRQPLAQGVPGQKFDVIFVNGAVDQRPDALLSQLNEGGRLVCIQRDSGVGRAILYVRGEGAFSARPAFDAQTPVLPGFEAAQRFVF